MKQGVKTRPSSKAKRSTNVRSISVATERKENIFTRENSTTTQSCSTSANSNRFSRNVNRQKGLSLRGKLKRENTQRIKSQKTLSHDVSQMVQRITNNSTNIINSKTKSDINVSKTESPKRLKVSSSYHKVETSKDKFKLKEIRFVKQNLSKKVIAKFVSTDSVQTEHDDDDEDLVVAWDADCTPRVMERDVAKNKSEPGTSSSKQSRGSFKNSFMSNKIKRPKSTLRRLSSANTESKMDKNKKRKKLKSKIL